MGEIMNLRKAWLGGFVVFGLVASTSASFSYATPPAAEAPTSARVVAFGAALADAFAPSLQPLHLTAPVVVHQHMELPVGSPVVGAPTVLAIATKYQETSVHELRSLLSPLSAKVSAADGQQITPQEVVANFPDRDLVPEMIANTGTSTYLTKVEATVQAFLNKGVKPSDLLVNGYADLFMVNAMQPSDIGGTIEGGAVLLGGIFGLAAAELCLAMPECAIVEVIALDAIGVSGVVAGAAKLLSYSDYQAEGAEKCVAYGTATSINAYLHQINAHGEGTCPTAQQHILQGTYIENLEGAAYASNFGFCDNARACAADTSATLPGGAASCYFIHAVFDVANNSKLDTANSQQDLAGPYCFTAS